MHRFFKASICFFYAISIIFNIPTARAAQDKELHHCLIQAKIQYTNSNYEEALEWYQKALAIDPQNKEANKYAKKAQEKLAKRGPKTASMPKQNKAQLREGIYIDSGKKYYSKEEYNWAIDEWNKALKLDPGNEQVKAYIERARERLGQKRAERKPPEADMIVKPPAPDYPSPVFEKPKQDGMSIGEALEIGMKNHLPVQIALEQLKLARFKEKESFRELFPQAMIRWDESSGVVSNKDFTGRKYQLKVTHPLYHGGELKYTWEQAKMNLKIAKENYDKTKEDYTLELTKAYYDYAKLLKNFDVQGKLLKDLEGDLAVAKKEYDGNITSLIDFLNVQSQYNQAYYAYLSSENTLSLARLNFLQLLNLDNDPSIDIKLSTQLVFKEHNMDLEECIKLAYENRTDLKINELSLKAAEYGERVAKSQQAPKIDLTGTIGKAGEVYTPGNLQLSNDWFLGAKLNVPWGPNTLNYSYTDEHLAPSLTVFEPTKNQIHSFRFNILDNMGVYTEVQRTEVTRQQAYSDLLKGKQTAATQVREAYFNYQESVLKVKNSLANKELYAKELAVSLEKRAMDEAQTQDIVQAKVKLAGEETNYNAMVAENILAVAKMNKAIGIKNYFK
jgi:outer membrane protein TolC